MQIAEPIWMIIGFFSCTAVYVTLHLMERRRQKALQSFAAKNLLGGLTQNVSLRKRAIKRFLLLLALFCCFIALARPQYGHRWIDVKRKGIDILFALDTSASMLAEDIQPNRLQRSKYAIIDFVSQLEGDRVGLMPFAGSSYLMCPLTVDYAAFEQSLQAVTTDIIPTPGTNIAQAIDSAEEILRNDANHKLLIIITDGENLDGDVERAALQAAAAEMTIFTVGVGTIQGELIPVGQNGSRAFVKNESGQFVTSRLDETNLRLIAEKTGGLYTPLGNRGQGLEIIYQQKLSLIPKEELAERRQKVPIERFPWALAAALALFCSEFLLNSRKRGAYSFNLKGRLSKITGLIVLVVSASYLFFTNSSLASPGEEAFDQEDYISASQYYQEALEKDPQNETLHYNHGTAAYKNNLFEEAIASFSKALRSDDLSLQKKAYFNLGNAHYRMGEESIQADPEKTIEAWKSALENYDGSLSLEPENKEARDNYALVKQKLEELAEQQKKKEQENNEGQDQQRNQSDKDNGADGEKQKKDKPENRQNDDYQRSSTEDNGPAQQQSEEHKEQQRNKPQPAPEKQEEAQPGAPDADAPQKAVGQLTREEAKLLLDELKDEEGALNFIPKKEKQSETANRRNW